MDCKTARLFLEFDRPAFNELDGADNADLRAHLAQCQECEIHAHTERRLDAHLGRAVRQVEVPGGLRDQILGRLRAGRVAVYRRWAKHAFRAAAVAATLLLGTWAWAHWHRPPLPSLNSEDSLTGINDLHRGPEEAQAQLRRLGADMVVPDDLNYTYLREVGITELPGYEGVKVPCLVFAGVHEHARVYLISARQMDLKALVNQNPGPSGKMYNLDIRYEQGDTQACLIFYTGGSLSWLTTTGGAV